MSRAVPRTFTLLLGGLIVMASAGIGRALPNRAVDDLSLASERAVRTPHRIVEYDVFGDSIPAGFGVPAHRTWVAAVSYHLFVTQPPDVEHRFYNHAVNGQSIVTPSFLANDPSKPSLLVHLADFLQRPERSTPISARRFVIMPSVNELVVSDAGTSGSARVAKAVAGVRTAVQLLRAAGVPARQIIVLPMPPIGARFVDGFDASVDVDQSLPSMIVAVNAGLTDILDVPGYPTLDGDNNGVAADRFFDDLFDPVTRRTADGLHLDIDGHEALAADIDDFFALR